MATLARQGWRRIDACAPNRNASVTEDGSIMLVFWRQGVLSCAWKRAAKGGAGLIWRVGNGAHVREYMEGSMDT